MNVSSCMMYVKVWSCREVYKGLQNFKTKESHLSTAYPKFPSCILFEICDVVIIIVVKVQQKENRDYRENLKKNKTGFMWNLNYPV